MYNNAITNCLSLFRKEVYISFVCIISNIIKVIIESNNLIRIRLYIVIVSNTIIVKYNVTAILSE